MRFRGFLSALVILCATTVPAAAQAPAPAATAFDGKYVGTATLIGGKYPLTCWAISSMDMTITGGHVGIHAIRPTGGEPTLRGSVNAAGEVSASLQIGPKFFTTSGVIHDKVFAGHRLAGTQCDWRVEMQVATAPTMPFDGWYRGVSLEVSNSESDGHHCDPRAHTPPRPLKITDGVIGIPGVHWWEGTVSHQGAVVMRNPVFSRVDGQIDHQGTIRGQHLGDLPHSLLEQIGGGGTNCFVKFVWQKE
jgi:hypothetical protein